MAATEYGVTEAIANFFGRSLRELEEDVNVVLKWTTTQPHFPETPDLQTVRNFLILNKCSIEKAKQKIDAYYTVRSKLENVYHEINPKLPHMQETELTIYLTPSRTLTKDLYRVIYFRVRDKSLADNLEPINVVRVLANMLEVRLQDDVMFADIWVIDCEGLPGAYLRKITPTLMYTLIGILQGVFSFRVKGFYCVNINPLVSAIIAMMKKLLKAKLSERIHTATNFDFLQEYLPKDQIPTDFGGNGPSLEKLQGDFKQKIEKHQDRFNHLDKTRVNENLRPVKLENDDWLGYHGNFKKLDID